MADVIGIGTELFSLEYGRTDIRKTEHWRSELVTGETKFSWLVGDPKFTPTKVNKKSLLEAVPNMLPRQWYTARQRIMALWIAENRHKIVQAVQDCPNVETLLQIRRLLEGQKNAVD